jgi:hypothetical protein
MNPDRSYILYKKKKPLNYLIFKVEFYYSPYKKRSQYHQNSCFLIHFFGQNEDPSKLILIIIDQ